MKKRQVFGLVVAGLLAGFVSSAVAQEAYSSTAVGVIKKTLPSGKLVLMSIPLDQDTDDGQGFIFGSVPAISNMPDGAIANFWDATNQRWVSQSKTTKNGWGTQKNRRILPGESFFLKHEQSDDLELIVSGEVPGDSSITRSAAGDVLTTVANPYPVDMVFTNFTVADDLPDGSIVNFWDATNQRWVSQSKTTKNGWGAQKNRRVQAGEGFFIKPAAVDVDWTEVKPYTWPKK